MNNKSIKVLLFCYIEVKLTKIIQPWPLGVTTVTETAYVEQDICNNYSFKIYNMAFHEIQTQWMGKMQFNALVNGHTIIMDAPARVGGEDNGPIPKPFVLTALSGCTGMDVVKLLNNKGITLDDFNLKIHGELSKGQPMEYVSIHVTYEVKGDAAHKEAAMDAVTTSQQAICGVSSMLKKALPVTWEVVYNGELLFTNKQEPISELA